MMYVLITGAGRGVGAATALRFAKQDYIPILVSRSSHELEEVAHKIRQETKKEAVLLPQDLLEDEAPKQVIERIKKITNHIDILVNNAGMIIPQSIEDVTTGTWDQVMTLNARVPYFLIQQCLPLMKSGSSIVNVSSLSGIQRLVKFPQFSTYSMSKFAVVGMTESLCNELKQRGIRINTLAPGAIKTEMLDSVAPHLTQYAQPEEIAEHICYLARRDHPIYFTGTTLEVYSNG